VLTFRSTYLAAGAAISLMALVLIGTLLLLGQTRRAGGQADYLGSSGPMTEYQRSAMNL
jgi:hypothetical protein